MMQHRILKGQDKSLFCVRKNQVDFHFFTLSLRRIERCSHGLQKTFDGGLIQHVDRALARHAFFRRTLTQLQRAG